MHSLSVRIGCLRIDLNNFILAFSRFISLRALADTFFSDNGKPFCTAEKQLPLLLDLTEFHNSSRKRSINWVRIPPYSFSQAWGWESIVKLIKTALSQVLEEVRRLPSLIKLQTFVSDAIRIVNDWLLTTISDTHNDLTPIPRSCSLGQQLSPNTPVSTFYDEGDLRRDYFSILRYTLAQRFWLLRMKDYLPCLQGRNKWRTLRKNLVVGQMVLVSDAGDSSKRGAYRMGRIYRLHLKLLTGKEIVCRATVAVVKKNAAAGEIEYILRNISKITPR